MQRQREPEETYTRTNKKPHYGAFLLVSEKQSVGN